jgi:hypothetical protein
MKKHLMNTAVLLSFLWILFPINAQTHGTWDDVGYAEGRANVDFDADGVIDYCRVIGTKYPDSYVACNLKTADGGRKRYVESKSIDWGYPEGGRAWIDVNGDRRPDYCRVTGTQYPHSFVACTISGGTFFAETYQSSSLDWGYPETRSWIVYEGKPAFCRGVGNRGNPDMECRFVRFGVGLAQLESSADFKKPK